MAKKCKDQNRDTNSISNVDSKNSGSDSSNIFKTLFGDVPEQQLQSSVSSIFSEENPFRRKPRDRQIGLGLGFGSAEDVGNSTTDGECGNSNMVEVKKRKRKRREEKPGSDTGAIGDDDSGVRLEIKKWKRDELENAFSEVELEERGGRKSPDLGFDFKGLSKRGNGKEMHVYSESEDKLETNRGKDPDMDMEFDGTVSLEAESTGQQREKKKRKREEIEAEYEERRYGVVGMNDGGGEGGVGWKVVVGEKRKKVDDAVDMMMVSKEGFDDEAKLLRTVFVGNLPLKVKKKALFSEFSQFGEIESVRIRSIPLLDTKKPQKGAIIQKTMNDAVDSVHAYIVFKTEEAAQASLAHNMASVGGNHIRVDRACPPRKKLKGENTPLYDSKRTVFVGNLPFDVKDEEIYQLFSGMKDLESSIEAIQVIRDSGTSVGKGIAYVLFKTRGDANLVVRKRSLKLQDRELRLDHARSDLTSSKRKNPSTGERDHSPTKKLAVDYSETPESSNGVKTKSASSNQGLQASKSGVQKKFHPRVVEPVSLKSRTHEKSIDRTGKRPVVEGGGASEQASNKRKLESQTPESFRPEKKTRKFR